MMSVSLRVNTLAVDTDLCVAKLVHEFPHATIKRVSWYADALVLDHVDRNAILASTLITRGMCYVQSLPSMLPALVLNPGPHERILDMCAAPGGKTTQLSALMKNGGEIVANDVSRARVFKLHSISELLGATNITPHIGKGEFLWRTFADSFDAVLVDAPCSMGMERSSRELKALAKRQTYLLRSALACVKRDGRVVYSTCTDTREENEEVIEWICAHVAGIAVSHISLPLPNDWLTAPYIRVAGEKGQFFVAKFTRTS